MSTGKKNRHMLKVLIAAAVFMGVVLLAGGSAFPGLTASAVSQSELDALRQKQKDLDAQQSAIKAQISSLKDDQQQKQQYKAQLDGEISNVEAQIDNYNAIISAYDADITAKQNEISAKQADIDANYQKLKDRLYAIYLTGQASNLEIVLNSQSVMDLADKTQILQSITQYDNNLINTLQDEMQSVQSEKDTIEQNRSDASDARSALQSKQSELSGLQTEAKSVLADINSSISDANAQEKALEKEEAATDAAVDQWFKDYYASQKSQNNSGGYSSNGQFTWPTPGYTTITTPYGEVRSYEVHYAIDIGAAYGAKIVAADSGKVIDCASTGDNGGRGLYVVIDHGNGLVTLYYHCSSISVSTGQVVTKGQTIAHVGSSGHSTGPHLHFEVRLNGNKVNPMSYFS